MTDSPQAALAATAGLESDWISLIPLAGQKSAAYAGADAILIDVIPDDAGSAERALGLLSRLKDAPAPALVLDRGLPREKRVAFYRAGALGFVRQGEDPEELAARISGLLAAKMLAATSLRRLREHTRHLDEQLRLAQRLQMDFLPRRLPSVEGARFAARLEPAAWVAGDFYDIFRLDEHHVGFYVADAVGHGIPAALLTVFVKKSLQTKRIEGKRYELIGPDEALRLLNVELLSAELQETPFITMVYGIYNESRRECTYALAGHPRPLVLGPKGSMEELDGEGPLLGIFADGQFEVRTRRLEPGQRLLLYSDGAERVDAGRRADPEKLLDVVRAASLLPVEALLDSILDAVRSAAAGEHLADDVTLVALELDSGETG